MWNLSSCTSTFERYYALNEDLTFGVIWMIHLVHEPQLHNIIHIYVLHFLEIFNFQLT